MNPTEKKTDNGSLGDVSSDVFRKQLHEMADWIADYRESIAAQRISPTAPPGTIRAALPAARPRKARRLEAIMADFERVIAPGITHWAHPQFMGYFGATTTGPGILAEMLTAALNVNAMTWRTSPAATELETVVLGWLQQWLGLDGEFDGVVYDTASVSTMHALAAAREEASTSVRTLGFSGRSELPHLPRLRFRSGAQLGRESRHRPRPRRAQCPPRRERLRIPNGC